MNLTTLNSFSSSVYGMIARTYPSWVGRIEIPKNDAEVISLQIPSPHSSELQLEISTYDEEITVSYGGFHCHYGWPDVSDELAFAEARALIDDIVNDRILIAEFRDHGKLYESCTIKPEEADHYKDLGPDVSIVGWNKAY